MVIGGEGALVLGGLAAAVDRPSREPASPPLGVKLAMAVAGMVAGGRLDRASPARSASTAASTRRSRACS